MINSSKIIYLGDDTLSQAAIYLAGIMEHYGLDYDYVPSANTPDENFLKQRYALYVISDYPAANFSETQMRHIVESVRSGSGLLMLGGWASFHGRLGEYHHSPLAEALPVAMQESDDRVNHAQPCLIQKAAEHEILAGLPWDTPPGIGGYNRFTARPNSQTLLKAIAFKVRNNGAANWKFEPKGEAPLLVIGVYGEGRTAALATDVAPHWVGGFVDWGVPRVTQQVGADFIEVGAWYAQFFRNLLKWTGNL
ncbi:MAG: glutamine amidotransferase [Candidatus Sumerlaeota bacterium]|nr:glutamine amidotransferase [Candidatus Sumerlaeota bacterium]